MTIPFRSLVIALALALSFAGAASAQPGSSSASPAVPDDGIATEPGFTIGPEDVLGVHVWREADVTGDVTVRADGMITLPLVRDVKAAGLTPNELAERIQASLREFITDAGLRTRPTEAYPVGRPLYLSEISRILTDRTYLGLVIWKGEEYPGEHEPLVEPEIFDRVQDTLAKRRAGTRERTWECYLKGLLWCARCGRRLVLDPARAGRGWDGPWTR